jgi:hypothetical protein
MIVSGNKLSGTVLIGPESARESRWLKRHVSAEPWQWLGEGVAVDARMAGAILEAAQKVGFKVGG